MASKKNEFRLMKYRLKIDNPKVLLVQGWYTDNEKGDNELTFILQGKRLVPKVLIKEGIEVRKKHLKDSYNIDKEYFFWLPVPDDIDRKDTIRVFERKNGKEKLSYVISCAKILKLRKKIDKYIDEPIIKENKVVISGWFASEDENINISICDKKNRPIEYTIRKVYRKDVFTDYPEAKEEQIHGFEISMEKKSNQIIKIKFCGGIKKSEFQMEINPSLSKLKVLKIKKLGIKVVHYLSKNGLKKTVKRTIEKVFKLDQVNYQTWREKNQPSEEELGEQRNAKFEFEPMISIVVPLYKTPEKYLREFVTSVKNQTYKNWQLCLSDGSGEDSPLKAMLDKFEMEDQRIKVISNNKQLQISENTNAAIVEAEGDYIAFADHDDLLAPDALYECVKAVNEDSECEAIYSDEDKITMDGKEYFEPHFKTDFNIDLLCSMNYICHLFVVKRTLIDKVGVLRKEYDGAQDYDFVLRCVEVAKQVYHIPKVLYHWRAHKDSTAENPQSKMYAFDAGARAVQAHYDRIGIRAKVHQGEYLGLYKTEHMIEEQPLVSILIPNKDHIEELEKCIQSIEKKSTYSNYEYIVIENNSEKKKTFQYYKDLMSENQKVRVVYWKEEFNYSAINNFGAKYAKGDYLLLLNNDTEIINATCIEELVGYCMHENVGAVGARLYYDDDTIQHAGVIIGFGGIAGHAFIGLPKSANGYFSRIVCAQDMSAVTAACMLVKKSIFQEIGGFDETLKVAFNDIDLCMKIRKAGYLIVYNPYAELYHYESKSRGLEDSREKVERFNGEIATFADKWPEILKKGDPYYNPNLSLDRCDFSLK